MWTKEKTLQELASVPEFKNLPPADLQWLVDRGQLSTLPDGDYAFKPGDAIDELRIILDGSVRLFREMNGNRRTFGEVNKYEITGRLPFSRMKAAGAYGVTFGDTVIFSLHKNHFSEMIREHQELIEILVHTMTDRVREFTQFQQQNEKMVALGKLSAGLAHELNNPSAAVVRGAQELKKHLSNIPERFKKVIRIQATDAIVDQVNDMLFDKIEQSKNTHLSLIEKSGIEDELTNWLDDQGIEDGYLMAETLADFGFREDDLHQLAKVLRQEDVGTVINWIYQSLTTERLVHEIEEASKRINTLVSSVKSYTHMDQAPERSLVDIHEGLRQTITVLNYKIRKNNIDVILEFEPNLKNASVFVSSMNQVWMNLIDNAIDALEGRPDPKIIIKTAQDREFTVVTITDNGSGIPAEIQERIFDAFFTTKAIGKGTGLGLEMVRQIVQHQHNGKVDVHSVPGKTVFTVCFPTL